MSHLCDTIGCISKKHLLIEPAARNRQRTRCKGIIIYIHEITASEYIIMQVDPCEHGEQHTKANGDYFKYSCRKIQTIFTNGNDALNFFV